jgi:hypothetical protein
MCEEVIASVVERLMRGLVGRAMQNVKRSSHLLRMYLVFGTDL